jgi:choline kinase
VQVQGRPLVAYTLKFAESLNCDRIFLVGGFFIEKLKAYLESQTGNLTLIENKDFQKGSILTLTLALDEMNSSFLLLNADHIYPLRMAKRFLDIQCKLNQITAFVDFDRPLHEDDMKVKLFEDRRIKKISKGLHEFDAGYIGATYVPLEKLTVYKRAAFELKSQNEEAVVENVLQKLVDQGEALEIIDMSGILWMEVDTQWDLKNAERILHWVSGYLN